MKIKDIQKQDRPREKLMSYGASSLSVEELLAIIINNGTREYSAIDLAKQIVEKADGTRGLAEITLDELLKVKGIGHAKAIKIFASLELSRRVAKSRGIQRYKIESPDTIAEIFMEELRYLKKEIVKVLLLDTKGAIVGDILVSEGSLTSSIVHPRELFKEAIVRSANKFILVHNHPSGDPTPSDQDIHITKRLLEVGELMGIELLDHVVIGDGEYISLKRNGYI